ncbi:STM4011 family radical SAM protein [Oceanirhabdus sp. W0125-5]|uniref:STM4011 family radical SAM protein n=1 Tax=Oceanirhabdus sp. W0125-5 TaxID=2999116 RepID=UPI0022F2E1D7|nr:STM4011 family radical SAM protein [Oceanirhabdus sp. W0125-5]WBW98356.1 STM4011 family radical SAM protein [Oceanirhabdus sp. W0125-5]
MAYTLYYRNFMRNCNYKCSYCPFAKVIANEKSIKRDKEYFNKFIQFIGASSKEFKIFFAPKGEILIHEYYKEGLIYLSSLKNVKEIVVQTNLSGSLNWLKNCNREKLILWTTYHPKEVDALSFFSRVKELVNYNIPFTVGTVGTKENFIKIEEMGKLLSDLGNKKPYYWINAFKDKNNYYNDKDIEFLKKFDSLFEINLENYKSKNLECRAGENVYLVEWNGNLNSCWQDKRKLGNLYKDDLDDISTTTYCNKQICGCFIGYNHIKSLKLEEVYKTSLIGRIP